MTGSPAKVYADALYSLGEEGGFTETLNEELTALSRIFEDNPEIYGILSSPTVSAAEKEELLSGIFEGKVNEITLNFLCLVSEKGRIRYLPQIASDFRDRWNFENNIMEVKVTSAQRLSEAQLHRLTEKLVSVYGKQVVLTEEIDPSVMGGLRLTTGGRQLDGTIRSKLDGLRYNMKNVIA